MADPNVITTGRIWKRVALIVLSVPNLMAGMWGLVAPRDWFDNFPGWAPRLVAALPPYNEHLATDAAAGLFASGVLAAVAAWWLRRDVILVAMVGYLAFAAPHALFHVVNPAETMTASEDVMNAASLVVAVVLAIVLLVTAMPVAGQPDREATRA